MLSARSDQPPIAPLSVSAKDAASVTMASNASFLSMIGWFKGLCRDQTYTPNAAPSAISTMSPKLVSRSLLGRASPVCKWSLMVRIASARTP